ncbi:DUF559 domain-containing protein [Mesorhizobium sp. CA12]|uniref:DUF559 domain-containing protein n=1 Tax=Mesorhizobium sp. CA12 TaxID=2876644 RepID=UPI00398D33B4
MPHQPVTPAKRNFARSMRREPTEAEDPLWHELRGRRLDKYQVQAAGADRPLRGGFRLRRGKTHRRNRRQPACGVAP